MKKVFTHLLVFLFLFLLGCSGGNSDNEEQISTIVLSASKEIILADDIDSAHFTIQCFDDLENSLDIPNVQLFLGDIEIEDFVFHSPIEGKYEFTAKYNQIVSNTIVIDVVTTEAPVFEIDSIEEGTNYSNSITIPSPTQEEFITYSATLNGNPYTFDTEITNEGNYTLIVTALNTVNDLSTTLTYTFDITIEDILKVSEVIMSPSGGLYSQNQIISLSTSTEEADIYYTTDGTEPTIESEKYESEIFVGSDIIIKAIAIKDGMKQSGISIEIYEIQYSQNLEMVSINSGSRSLNYAWAEDLLLGTVSIDNLDVSKYEITQSQFENVMGFNPSYHLGEDKPVEKVTIFDAMAYCNAQSIAHKYTPYYIISNIVYTDELYGNPLSIEFAAITINTEANGYRLPSLNEWYYLAVGGSDGNETVFSGSDDINEIGWYLDNSPNLPEHFGPYPVGKKSSNELGIYDMTGNVMEWTYTSANDSMFYVVGGGANSPLNECELDHYPDYILPNARGVTYGFRVVRNR